jgi:hypothetical protein
MGLLRIHDFGNLDSLQLFRYQQVHHNFDIWWDETVTNWIVEHLTFILRLKVHDEEVTKPNKEVQR